MNIPLNINLQQILLHLLNFAILAGGLYFLLYKPVQDFIARRTAHFQQLEDQAQDKLHQAEATRARYEEELRQVGAEIREERAKAQKSIQDMTHQQLLEAEQQASSIVESARAAAARSHDKAIQDARKELQDLAIAAAEKLVMKSDREAMDQFLNAAERGSSHGTEEP